MKIAVVKEIKTSEHRVAMTPSGVMSLTKSGHEVWVEKDAGLNSGFKDEQYQKAGAQVSETAEACYQWADMIVKVKEPLMQEYALIREGQIIFTYFHFAASMSLTRAMIERKAICVAYETIEDANGNLPLLAPMSAVAGKCAVQTGAALLEKVKGGKGVLLGGVPGVRRGNVVILGAGNVGVNAARVAAGMGANVYLLDINLQRLAELESSMPANVQTLFSSEWNIRQLLPTTDLVIGAVLIPGGKAPVLISKDMLAMMEPGSVILDVAVDQGGCIETIHPTTHDCPTYEVEGIIHYGVANIPGNVPNSSTGALTNATLPYILRMANLGWQTAFNDESLQSGFNLIKGKMVNAEVSKAFELHKKKSV